MRITPYFQALNLYHISKPLDLSNLEAQLAECRYAPASPQSMSAMGFVPALGDGGTALVHQVGRHVLVRICHEGRDIPPAALKREIKAVIKEREDAGQRLSKKDKDTIKDEVIDRLLPRAFGKLTHNRIWIDTQAMTLAVDTCSNHADTCLAFLRKALGSLPVVPFSPRQRLEVQMTEWLKSEKETIAPGFCIGQTVAMQGMVAIEQMKARSEGFATDSLIVKQALELSHHVTQLALHWRGNCMAFTLADSGAITRIGMETEWCELPAPTNDQDDVLAAADANFVLSTGILAEFVAAYRELIQDETRPPVEANPITADQVRDLLALHADITATGSQLTQRDIGKVTGLGPLGIEQLIAEANATIARDQATGLEGWTISLHQPTEDTEQGEEEDYLYDHAVAFVGKTRRASTSSIQRQFKIGYNRAARLIEKMEAAGLISAAGHNGQRDVLFPGAAS